MNPRVNYALVGVFVIALGAALTAGLLWLWAGGPQEDQEYYVVEVRGSVAGLNLGAPVLFQGVDVGRVEDIRIAENNPELIRVLLEVRDSTPIKEDTVAELKVRGLTGLVDVNLVGTSREAPKLEAAKGEKYPVIPSRPSLLPKLEESLPRIVDNVEAIAEQLKSLVGENKDAVQRTMANVEAASRIVAEKAESAGKVLDSLAAVMEEARRGIEDANAALANVRDASEDLPSLVSSARAAVKDLRGAIGAARDTLNAYEDVGERLEGVVQSVGGDLERFAGESLPQLYSLFVDVRETVQSVNELAEQLARNPKSLLFGKGAPASGPGE